jgi:hypothetical protein
MVDRVAIDTWSVARCRDGEGTVAVFDDCAASSQGEGADQNLPRLISKELEMFTEERGLGNNLENKFQKGISRTSMALPALLLAQGAAGNQKAPRGPGAKNSPGQWAPVGRFDLDRRE